MKTVTKASGRARNLVFAFYMSGLMSMLMSCVITFINTGIDPGFFLRWGQAFVVAWGVAFPLVSFIAPLASRLTEASLNRFDRARNFRSGY